MTRRTRLRKAGRITAYGVAGLIALAVVFVIGAPIYFQGERFGELVEHALPDWRGRAHIGGGHWSWGAVIALVRGRPAAVDFQDVTITDPEGVEVLHIENLAARIELHRKPGTRIIIHDLVIKDARWRFARMKGANRVGFLAAFETIPRKARRKPSKPTSSEISIAGARLEGVEATLDFPTWGLVLRDVHAAGALGVKNGAFTFEVTGADARGGGRLRILGEKSGIVLPIDRGRIDRVATTTDDPDSIHLDASGVAVGGSRIAGTGRFTGIYGVTPASKHSGVEYDVRLENAADAINAIAAHRGLGGRVRAGGGAAQVRLRFARPFDHIAIEAAAHGLDLAGREIEVRDVEFQLATEPLDGRFRLERLSLASPAGGRLRAEATLDRLQLDASLTFARFAARPLLPSVLRPIAGDTIDGILRVRANLLEGDAELVRSTLVITRPTGENGPAAVALIAGTSARPPPGAAVVRLTGAKARDGVVKLPHLTFAMWGGSLAAEGRIALWDPDTRSWLAAPRLDLTLQAGGVRIERLIGSSFAAGAVSFGAHARGSTEQLTLDLTFSDPRTITVLGEKVRLPPQAALRLADSIIDLGNLPLGGPADSSFVCSGRIALSGRLALDVGVVRFPIARLPGLSGTTLPVGGSISGAVRITGAPRAPALSGQFTLAGLTVAQTSLGGGTIDIAPERHGGVRAHGHLADAIAVDGRLVPKAAGLEGDLTLTLSRLPIAPFLPPSLPGGFKAAGFMSGTGTARIAPGQLATAEAKLSELTLSLFSTNARNNAAAIEVRAENEITLHARAGGDLSLSPARFRSGAGWIELAGESHGEEQRASLRGHLELGAAAPFVPAWFKRLAGSLEVDLSARSGGARRDVVVNGDVVVAAPVSVALATVPVEAVVAGGRLRIADNVVQTDALPVAVRAQGFPIPAVRKLDANARVSGRLDAASARGKLAARIALDNLDVHVPLVGRKPVHSAGGTIEIAGDVARGKLDVTRIDLPFVAEAEALAAAAGVSVDRAAVALRVRGTSRQLTLSGDVDVGSAHVRADALKKKTGGAGGTGGTGKGPLADHPEIEGMRLDVNVRSQGGAINVDVNNLPDLRLDVDMHVGGTVKKPSISGEPRGADVWSRFVLAIAKLFS